MTKISEKKALFWGSIEQWFVLDKAGSSRELNIRKQDDANQLNCN
jgi:hypothetical protein